MSLYKNEIRDVVMRFAIEKIKERGYSEDSFMRLKIEYKWTLKDIMREMQKEIDAIDNEIHGWETQA